MNANDTMRTSHNRDRRLNGWATRILALQLTKRNNRLMIDLQDLIQPILDLLRLFGTNSRFFWEKIYGHGTKISH